MSCIFNYFAKLRQKNKNCDKKCFETRLRAVDLTHLIG